jgi:hypothetical protein
VTAGVCPLVTSGEKDKVAEERNPLEMTEEEIAEAHGELPPDRRAMSVTREVETLLEDPPPEARTNAPRPPVPGT